MAAESESFQRKWENESFREETKQKRKRERERDSKGQINKLCLREGRVFVIVRDSLAEGIEWNWGRDEDKKRGRGSK